MNRTNVMHLVDSLQAGGTERVAVNLVNSLPRDRYIAHLCTTRFDGPLSNLVQDDVGRICLHRKRTWDFAALRRLVQYLREHQVKILHAHASSVLIANLASRFAPYPKIVWHDHYGINANQERPAWIYRLLMGRVSCVLAVSQRLLEWSRDRLHMPANQVLYIPNFVCRTQHAGKTPELPGAAGSRIACVANLRPVKDHLTLLRAMALVVQQVPTAHLLLIGAMEEPEYLARVKAEIAQLGLEQQVSLLGQRTDVAEILQACDVGVLSSSAEGLPLSLLEYGLAGLAVVSTRVGQCSDVLEEGEAGLLVPRQDPAALGTALRELLQNPALRESLSERYQQRVANVYSAEAVMGRITEVYDSIG